MKKYSIGLIIILCFSGLTPAYAEWGRTAEDYISLPLYRDAHICSDGNGGCWATGQGVGLSHVDRNGNLTWGMEPFFLQPRHGYDQSPVLADNGDVIIAMKVYNEDNGVSDVYIQRVNLDQELVWGESGIQIDTSSRIQWLKGAYAGPVVDTYLIHWVRCNDNFRENDLRLQLINGDGDFLWGINGIGLNRRYLYAYISRIVISSDRCVIAAHTLFEDDEGDLEVHKIDSDGERLWDSKFSTRLEDERGGMKLRDIESDRAGGSILVYEYSRLEYLDDGHLYHFGIKAMRVSGDGDSLWTRQVYEREEERQGETPSQFKPILNYAGSGRFFIAWADFPHVFKVVALNIDG
ncbi:MAG: hypothetical protein P9X24_18520, partial [Candidatus Hatepunaea meridiana]|nr:hypothetical protein [Candidatus Hatepunaea meridiana]